MKLAKKILATALISCAALTSMSTSAATTSEKLDKVTAFVTLLDMEPSHSDTSIFYDMIKSGTSESDTVPLTKDREYMFIGVCDDDCDNIHLKVYDPNGKVVASDLEGSDGDPIKVLTTFTARQSGDYRVEVTMVECSTSHCFAQVGSYRNK